jgi:Flp pilus assembly protein TadG
MPAYSGQLASAGTHIGATGANSGGLLRRFHRDSSGSVAMMFGLVIVPLAAVVGLAVDFGRAYAVRSQTQSALDAAALAAGRVAQVETDIVKASAAATAFFNQTKPKNVVDSALQFSPNSQNTAFTVTATSWVRTPFLGVLHMLFDKTSQGGAPVGCQGNYFACAKMVTTATSELKAGGAGGSNVEVALMLDITGSMAGQKLTDMQDSAKDLIDIVVWNDQSEFTSKVAIAPFAPRVNVGSYMTTVTGMPATKGSGNNQRKIRTCVTERTGAQAATDEVPGSNAWLNAYDGTRDQNNTNYTNSGSCSDPGEQILPLTSNKDTLKDRINSFTASGTTAGQLGTAWAWYLISPNWNGIWPVDSQAAPYSDITTLNAKGAPKLQKIAVLMTDGIYNTLLGTQYGDNSNQATQAANKAKALCTGMKDKGIIVYTVGFDVDANSVKNMLKNCATDNDHYYDASTGDALKAAFRDIALKISSLRLTH